MWFLLGCSIGLLSVTVVTLVVPICARVVGGLLVCFPMPGLWACVTDGRYAGRYLIALCVGLVV